LKHIRKNGGNGTPFKELEQVDAESFPKSIKNVSSGTPAK
jgi:hypothetical protein